MGFLQTLAKGVRGDTDDFKEKLKDAQEEVKIHDTIVERQKSSNQREVERRMREEQEEEYKKILHKVREKENKDNWKSPNKVIGGKATMMKTDRPILKEKNIFKSSKKNSMGFLK